MNVVLIILGLAVLSYILIKSTDMLISGLRQISSGTSLGAYGLTAVLVALATSLPELFVSAAAALKNNSELALGLVLGSNIANLSLVVGLAALMAGAMKAADRIYKRDIFYAFLIGSLPLVMLIDRKLSRLDGLVLLLVYVLFNVVALTSSKKKELKRVGEKFYGDEKRGLGHKIFVTLENREVEKGLRRLALGSALLIVSAELIVRLANQLAVVTGFPIILVGLFMIAVGTSLPELIFEIRTITRGEHLMAFGNIIGSTVANSSLILGVTAMLSPIVLAGDSRVYLTSVVAFVVVFLLFWLFTYTKRELSRWEGLVLVLVYFSFVLVEIKLL